MKSYYAEQSPRGFANETNTYRFTTKAVRDKWVAEHESDGDCNSASQGARSITAAEARRNVGYKGDAATQSYNSGYIDGNQELANEATGRYARSLEA
jgi:hypothetical protein